ncbi:MAG TPA: mycofactocin biosynthesis chaperone MftB [Acidimicrobiales bacterium]|nr:mycofactocin biosynthesis chaperone MftB [Acidimicrobiales bacterium]
MPARTDEARGTFELANAYQLDDRVAIRPEPFGALAYHYGNRRLVFLRAPELVELVRILADHPSAEAAMAAAGIPDRRRAAFGRALASLEAAEVIRAR